MNNNGGSFGDDKCDVPQTSFLYIRIASILSDEPLKLQTDAIRMTTNPHTELKQPD